MNDSIRTPDARLRQALEDAAPDLGLELEEEQPKKLSVGALVPAAYATADTDQTSQPADAGADDDTAIGDLIRKWENTGHDEALQVTQEVTTDPYVAVTAQETQLIDSDGLQQWVDSDAFQDQAGSFERHESAERKVSDVSIEYVGPYLASCTYRVEEEGKSGVYTANSAVIARKCESGWRIAVVTKHATISDS